MGKKPIDFSIVYFILTLAFMLVSQYLLYSQSVETLSYSQFKTLLKHGQVTDIVIQEKEISGAIKPEGLKAVFTPQKIAELGDRASKSLPFRVFKVEDPGLTAELEEASVSFKGEATSDWLPILLSWVLPMILFFVLWTLWSSRMGLGGGLMQIGKSKAKVYIEKTTGVTFADVEGIEEAEEELIEVVEFLKHPEKYQRLGGHLPKGVLLVGPPGTGKTLLARAVAGEAGVPFFSISGSDFVEMFVGVGAARVRDLFAQAAQHAPSIIFIDELDALGKARGINMLSSHDEREQTLNQLLAEMDGFDPNKNVIMMAATNRPEVLDPALLRPGRFDRQVLVDRPDVKGREKILLLHAKKIKLASSVDLALIAAKTPGFVGADLANIVNEAALLAARQGKDAVEMAEFDEAIDRIVAGLQKKSRVMRPAEKKTVAYHESGHALVAELLPGTDPVSKISIIPRGIAALGYTQQTPTEDRYLMMRTELLARIYVLLGGRVAEEMVFSDVSTGAQNDLHRATEIARTMVTQFGMSDKLGLVSLEGPRQPLFLPVQMQGAKEYSDDTARLIDAEVKQILTEGHEKVKKVLATHHQALEELAQLLLRKEVVERSELQAILKILKIDEVREKKKAGASAECKGAGSAVENGHGA